MLASPERGECDKHGKKFGGGLLGERVGKVLHTHTHREFNLIGNTEGITWVVSLVSLIYNDYI